MWNVLQATCTVVGALVLYSLVLVGLWSLLVAFVRRTGREFFVARGHERRESGPRAAEQPLPEPLAVSSPERRRGDRRQPSWSDVPAWVASNRDWAAVVLLLGAPPIAERTHRFVHFGNRRVDWPELLQAAATWSERDRLLVLTAYDLSGVAADPPAVVRLHDLADADEPTVQRVSAAFELSRGRVSYAESLTRAGGLG